ncbi:MAG: hypothetical protein NTV88_01590 [Candidatus Micrarchaeota archaeon]|nr:hypothetical protein [Candidatus Micrarchaeota archaeon]
MKLWEISNEPKVAFALRLVLLLILPFMLGAFVFPHTQLLEGSVLATPVENTQVSEVLSYSFSSSGSDIGTQNGIGSAFPLSSYLDFPPLVSHERLQLCFADNGTGLILSNGTAITPEMEWQIYLNNNTPILLKPGSFACADINRNEGAVYAWTAKITGLDKSVLNSTITFNPATRTYPRVLVNYGLLQGLAMIPVFYLVVWYPLIGIWRKLHEGMLAQ